MESQKTLPDCDVAPLTRFPPEVLQSGDDDLDGFILALALAFNDVKALMWFSHQLDQHRPSPIDQITPYAGEWHGFNVFVNRYAAATIHELFELVEAAGTKGLLSKPAFQAVLRKAPVESRAVWAAVEAVALDRAVAGPYRKYLVQLRNNAAFHYSQTKALIGGYRAHFADRSRPHSRWAYVSAGPRMEATRFYFADAAADRYMRGEIDPSGQFWSTNIEILRSFNLALRYLVEGYLGSRKRVLTKSVSKTLKKRKRK